MVKKTRAYNMLPTRDLLNRAKKIHMSKVKGWKKAFNANRNDKKVGIAILI